MLILLSSAILLVSAAGCRHTRPSADRQAPGQPVAGDVELELLKQAAAWPAASEVTVLSLLGHYTAAGRDSEAQRYFEQRTRQDPERPLFLALDALFRARLAGEVPLLRRLSWVKESIAMLDRAAARDPGLSRLIRALVLAQLPDRFGQAERATEELRFLLEAGDSPFHPDRITITAAFGLRRAGWQALARAYHTLDRPNEAEAARRRSGASSIEPRAPLLATSFSVGAADGFRFGPRRVWSPEPGVFVASGHDFADIAFVDTGAGVVAIDAGTTPDTAARAWEAVRPRVGDQPIRMVILTHGHWDHAGGLQAYLGPGVEVVAHADFPRVLARSGAAPVAYRYFFGQGFQPEAFRNARPTRTIRERTALHVGNRELVIHPTTGGETEDALLVELAQSGLVFVGDAFMPYVGAPFVGEGSPQGLLETIELLGRLRARRLVHGHAPLTDLYTAEALPPLALALRDLEGRVLDGVARGQTAADMQHRPWLPASLRASPPSVMPYLLMRENLIARLQRDRTGYWQPDGSGLRPHTRSEWGAALDLLAGGDDRRFATAGERLIARGEFALGLEIAQAGLAVHPGSDRLQALRRQALDRLREKYQGTNPFKFIVYSELAGAELPPLD
jgi:glyoxylase-like metal-dependent hydrolase (beta-lactamase superfamily II)